LFGVTLARQPDGDLGVRMLAAVEAARGPVIVIGTDCPALQPAHLRAAAEALAGGVDAVVVPVEDGGYALIGMREPQPALFAAMPWSTAGVMPETRRRLTRLSLSWREPARLWDVDLPEDVERMKREGLAALMGEIVGWVSLSLNASYVTLIIPSPATISSAAATRTARSGSRRITTAISAPNSTLVSRSPATTAIGATVIAHSAIPYEANCSAPPAKPVIQVRDMPASSF